jgi:hypothetical protein
MRWNLVLDGGQPIADRLLACYEALTEHPFYLIAIQTTPAISTPTTASVLGDALGIAGRQVFHRSALLVPSGVLSGSMAMRVGGKWEGE